MALGPQATRKTRDAILKKAERIIDGFVRTDVQGDITININMLPARFGSSDWNDILAPKYKAAGWRVAKWVEDQREGNYIHLIA